MITLKGNIEFLTNYNLWRRDVNAARTNTMPSPTVIGLNIDYAIESLKMLEAIIKDIADGRLVRNDDWDEARIDVVGSNGNDGLHYD